MSDRCLQATCSSFSRVGIGYVMYNLLIWIKQRKLLTGVQENHYHAGFYPAYMLTVLTGRVKQCWFRSVGVSEDIFVNLHCLLNMIYFGLACKALLECTYFHSLGAAIISCQNTYEWILFWGLFVLSTHKLPQIRTERCPVYSADRCMGFYGLIIPHRRTLYIQKLKWLTFIDSPSKLVQSNDLNYPYPNLFPKSLKKVSRPPEKSV